MTSVAFKLFLLISMLLSANIQLAYEISGKGLTSKSPSSPEKPIRDKWAVVVGLSHFQDPTVKPLHYGTKNASELTKLLQDPMVGRFAPGHILTLTGKAASKQAIEDSMIGSWLAKKALPNDLIVIYLCTRALFSQDGTQINLCAYDTLVSDIEVSGINLENLLTEIRRRTGSRQILCLLDTTPCPQAVTAPTSVVSLNELARHTGVSLLAANELSKPSYESSIASSSYFAYYLTEGFRAGGGLLPLAQVASYVIESVKLDVLKTIKQSQCPAMALAVDNADMGRQSIGLLVKGSQPANRIAIGHPVGQLALTRPDLATKRPAETNGPDEEEEEPKSDVDFGSYMTKMKQNIQKHWQPPKGFENRRVVATFIILRDGTITHAELVESSGREVVDKSALDALKAASPLEPLPLGAPKSVQIRYQFDWRITRN